MEQCPSLGCVGRTYTSDAVVPVHEGLPENQASRCHQVLEAEDEGAKEPVTKSLALATLHTASVLSSDPGFLEIESTEVSGSPSTQEH